jgi:hypothetical protein
MSGTAFRLVASIPDPGKKEGKMAEEVSKRLFPPESWPAELDKLDRSLSERYRQEFSSIERQWLDWLARELAPYRQDEPLPEGQLMIDFNQRLRTQLVATLEVDRIDVKMGAGLGVGTLLAREAITRVGARAATARAAARLAGRSAAGSSSVACGFTGPWAVGCAVVVFTGATLAMEWVVLRTDEALNRPDLEKALHTSVDALRTSMMEDHGHQLLHSFEEKLGALNAGIHGSLRPIDQIGSTPPGGGSATTVR